MGQRTFENDPTHGRPKSRSKGSLEKLKLSATGRRVSWLEVDAVALLETVHAVVDSGGAIILGATRDGGAYSITYLDDASREKFYPTTNMDAEVVLAAIKQALAK